MVLDSTMRIGLMEISRYSPTITLVLCAPPFIFAALMAFFLSRYVTLYIICNVYLYSLRIATRTRYWRDFGTCLPHTPWVSSVSSLPYPLWMLRLDMCLCQFTNIPSTKSLANDMKRRFLMAQSYAGFVCMYAWMSNSFPRPPSKRAVALALINAVSQTGNVAGSVSLTRFLTNRNWPGCASTSGQRCGGPLIVILMLCVLFLSGYWILF